MGKTSAFFYVFLSLMLLTSHLARAQKAPQRKPAQNATSSAPTNNPATATPVPAPTPTTPPVPARSPTEPEPRKTETASEYKQDEALFGFHAALGFPQVVGYGIDYYSADRTWGAGLALGGFGLKREKSGTDPDFKFSYGGIHVSGRYHPFHGAFFTGLNVGSHSARIEATDTYLGQSITATGRLRGNYATPHVGFLWITRIGITISTELGAQFNFGGKTDIDEGTTDPLVLNDSTYKKNKKDAEDQGNAIFNGTIPYLALIRVGYAF